MNNLFNRKQCGKKNKKSIPSEFAKVAYRLPRAIVPRKRDILNYFSKSNFRWLAAG